MEGVAGSFIQMHNLVFLWIFQVLKAARGDQNAQLYMHASVA